jgi:hypothetical protein
VIVYFKAILFVQFAPTEDRLAPELRDFRERNNAQPNILASLGVMR